ncbi:hypothetical protein JW948_14505 [bacterium]|nr:hypothetical protein [bacterium]
MKVDKKNLIMTIVMIGLVLILIAGCGEAVLRIIGFEFVLYPSKIQFGWPDPLTMQKLYRPDDALLWVPYGYHEHIETWTQNHPTIATMGCSCTEYGAYDDYLDSLFVAADPESGFSIANVGVGGWSSYQGLQQLKRDIVRIKPRLITIYYGWNDHWCTFGIEDKDIGSFQLGQPRLLLKLSSHSRFVQFINKLLFMIRFSDMASTQRVALPDFKSNLREMIRVARENDIIPVLLTAPSSHKRGEEPPYLKDQWIKNLADLVPLHERYVQAVREVAAGENADCVDLYAVFRKLPESELHRYIMKDGIHLHPAGSKKVAEVIYAYMKEHGLADELARRQQEQGDRP